MSNSPKKAPAKQKTSAEKAQGANEKLKDHKQLLEIVDAFWKLANENNEEPINLKYKKNGDKYEIKHRFDTDPEPPYYRTFISLTKTSKGGRQLELSVEITHDGKDSSIRVYNMDKLAASAHGVSKNGKYEVDYKNKNALLHIVRDALKRLQKESKRLYALKKQAANKKDKPFDKVPPKPKPEGLERF